MSNDHDTDPPVQATPMDVDAMLADRYGTGNQVWLVRSLILVVAFMFVATLAWVGVQLLSRTVEGRLIGWTAVHERLVEVDMEVRGEHPTTVQCIVRAKDVEASDVGYAHVVFESAPARRTVWIETVVGTSQVEVLGCAPLGSDLAVPPPAFPPGVLAPDHEAQPPGSEF